VLAAADPAVCDEVVAGDDQVDRRYLDVDLHLERIADMAVTVVKLAKLACALPPEPRAPAKSRFVRFVPQTALARSQVAGSSHMASHERAWTPIRPFRYFAGTLDVRARARDRRRVGRRAFGSPAAPRPCPAGPTAGEYGGYAPCGSGLAVLACLVGWSEPGNQAKGGDTW
jgi:hypothetical protein